MPNVIQNPILPGFHPDPSICRVGEDYYIANSTFEWFVNWRLIGHALTRPSQLDLRGIVDSGGVWAPSLSHADGQFWLVYTNIRQWGMGRPFKDIGIYLTVVGAVTLALARLGRISSVAESTPAALEETIGEETR